MSNRSRYQRTEARCRFCGESFWAHTKARLDAWMAHHTVKLCPVAQRVAELARAYAVKQREEGTGGTPSPALDALIREARASLGMTND